MSFRLDHAGTDSRGRIRTCISRVRGEVTVVFTTRQSLRFNKLAGEPTRKADSGHELSRYFMLRDYAPVPGTLIPGRVAALRVDSFGAKYLSSFTTGETNSCLIQESYIPHGVREILCVTENLVPAIQRDRLVIRMAHSATNIDLRVASHDSPIPATPFALRDRPVLLVCETVWCAWADINGLPTKAIKLFTDMGLPPARAIGSFLKTSNSSTRT